MKRKLKVALLGGSVSVVSFGALAWGVETYPRVTGFAAVLIIGFMCGAYLAMVFDGD
jgi:hypothetical protein